MKIGIMPHSRVSSLSPGRIALGYAVIAILWVAFSDALVTQLNLPSALMTIKGTAFVFVTASLLYFTMRRLVQAVQLTSRERDETAELYRTVVEASNEGICLLDESGRISFLNGRLAAMLGRPAEELEGKRLQDFIEEPHVLAQPGAQQSETRECRLRKDSDPKPWVLISRHSVVNEAGDVVGLMVTVIDITERKRAEKALRRSEAYLTEIPEAPENLRESQLASLARYGLAILSVGVALAAALFLQYLHFRDVAIPLLLLAVASSSWFGGRGPAILAAILSTISFYWYFVEPVQTIYIYWSNVPYFIIFVTFGVLVSWFATIRRRVEAGLREQAALLNLTHDTVFVMDMEGVIKYWNRGAEEQYGWSAEQALGKVVHDMLKTVFPSPLEEIRAEVTHTGRWEGELLHTNKHGTQLVVTSRWSLQRDRHGAPVAILETNNDICERKRAEEALSRLNRELRAISDCNQVLLRATDEQSLLEEICRIVCEEAGYRMAWVGYAEHDEPKSVRPVAWTGVEEGYLTNLGITWADTERGRGPTGTAIRSGNTCCIQDFGTDPRLAPWRESVLPRNFRSGIALPLKDERANAFGSLTIYSAQPAAFTSEEIRLLEELAADLAFGIVTLRARAARERAEQEVALLSSALDKVREAAFLVDERGRFHYVNEAACRILGYTRAELLDLGVADIDPEFPAERWSDHWRDLKAQRSLGFESRHRTPDGRTFPVEVSANYFEYGGRAYNLALVRDITERKRAEEELRRSEGYLAEAQRLSRTGSWALDVATGEYSYWSEEMFRIFGVDPRGGIPVRETQARRILPEDRDRVMANFEKSLRKKVDTSDEYRFEVPDGTIKHLHVIRHPVLNEAGEIVRLVGTFIDITERKRAEDALRRREAYLAEAQRLSHTGSWASDNTTKPLYWSEELFRIYGFDPQQGLPTREQPLQRIHPEDLDNFLQAFDRAIHGKVDSEIEYRIVLPDGTVKYVLGTRHPILNATGEVVEMVGTAVDVTEYKRAQEALRRTAGYLADAQRLTHTGGWASDITTKPLYWSEELFRIFGFDPQLGLPTQDQPLQRIHPEDRDRFLQAFDRAIRGKVDSDVEYRIVLPDGTVKHAYGMGHPVLNASGEVVELVGTTVDITERKRAEEERERLRHLEADLAHINRVSMMGELAASVAHEVNQPISGVVSNGSACLRWLAREVPDVEEAREAARRIVRDGKRAGEIIARIRALASKRAAINKEELNLNETIQEVLALVGDEAKKKSVTIRTDFAADIPPVSGDRVQLQQVALNLIMNAIEAMSSVSDRARELVITTRNVDANQVRVMVEDSGIGIDPQMIDKIFDSFYTTKPGGMGMGLSISRSILEAHGGRLWAEANDGPGTTLHFTLPKYHQEGSDAAVAGV